jgi:hypothetical protein
MNITDVGTFQAILIPVKTRWLKAPKNGESRSLRLLFLYGCFF